MTKLALTPLFLAAALIWVCGGWTPRWGVATAAQTPAANAPRSQQDFINVEGPDLASRLAAANKQGAAQQRRFWVAYTFAVRLGVPFDVMFIGSSRSATVINGATVGSQFETRNLGVFLLYEAAGAAPVRAEIYNLDRPRDYAGYPVYWLGRGAGDESLPLLRSLVDLVQTNEAAGRLADAIGAHDEPRAPATLRDVVRAAKRERARTNAVSWLGHWPEQTEFLAALVRDEREVAAVRREAAEAIGDSLDRAALPLLQDLYGAVTHREIKRELLDAIADDRFEGASVGFLIATAEREADRELRGAAIEGLGQRTDTLSLQALEKAASNSAGGVELQRAAVEAISERPEGEALPLLKKIARSHPRGEVRSEALERLGERSDQLPFLVELAGDRNESIELRRNAIEAIAETEAADAFAALSRLFDVVNNRELKEEVIDAIANSADRPAAIGFLAGVVRNDGDPEVRQSAVDALGDLSDERAVDALTQLYDAARDEQTKDGILGALSEADGARALQKLMAVAQRDPSVKLRRSAIALLGESDDPVAVRFLEQLIK